MRLAQEQDYMQLAEMKWLHSEEDDIDYNTNDLAGVDKHKEYKIFIASDNDVVVSAMFVYMIPKTPKPNRDAKYIAYLTNVYTIKEYRNKKIGTELLTYIKDYLVKEKCELMFAWPSENSVNWYSRNGFCQENEIFECTLGEE